MIRTGVLAVFVFGVAGLLGELLLLEHTEDLWQWTPIILLAASFPLLGWHGLSTGAIALRVFRAVMVLFVVAGAAGLFLHYRGNVEFELEMHPGGGGLSLIWEALKGATPALAPGTLIQFGFLGLLYCYKHPRLDAGATKSTE